MEAIVLYSSPGIGHLLSIVELGKLILKLKPSLSVHILIFTPPFNTGSTAPYIEKVSATIPCIIFHQLPSVTLPPSTTASSLNHETLTFEILELNIPNVHQTLISISNDYTIFALIADFFNHSVLSVTAKLNIPTYVFYTSAASTLTCFLHAPTIHKNTSKSLKDMNTLIDIPGIPPVPSKEMPKPMLERDNQVYRCFLDCSIQWSRCAGIIVNTFESLEPRAIKAITDGLCVLDGPTPPIYCTGPLIAADGMSGSTGGEHRGSKPEWLTWLDSQPSQSVVFLCFGSLGLFSVEQLKEIAIGLERSGQRFLWVVRNPPSNKETLAISAPTDPDLDSLLPQGFLDRTKERGFVVKSWAPQVAVLSHDSVGGFVTHSGWNSVLEAVCAGVPMVAWPLYAEQTLIRVVLAEEFKIALPMIESENGLVTSAEVEKRVRQLMDAEEGNLIRKRIMAMKSEANRALGEGGSSRVALTKLFESWEVKMSPA